jgi:hypothetical protein
MSKNRHSEDEIESLNIPSPASSELTLFGAGGKKVSEDDRVYAKIVVSFYNYDDRSVHYFIKISNGEIIDPYGADSSISKGRLQSAFAFRKVGKKTFDSFIEYLKNKNRIHFTTSRRLLLAESTK